MGKPREGMEGYASLYKDGKFLYQGVLGSREVTKLMEIAKNNKLSGLDVNDYISYVILNFDDENM